MTVAGTTMVQDGPVADTGNGGKASSDSGDNTVPTLEFVAPIAGFPEHLHFILVELDETGLLCSLQSLESSDLRFLVLPPGPFFADYEPEISQDWADQLEITDPAEALVLVIVTTGASAADATANLLAPVVINLRTRRAAQIVLEDTSMPLRAPLRPAS